MRGVAGVGWGLFEIGRPRSREWKDFGRKWTEGVAALKIGQLSWTSYVYYPLFQVQLLKVP